MERDTCEWVEDAREGLSVVERAGGNDAWLESVGALILVELSLETFGWDGSDVGEGDGGGFLVGEGRKEGIGVGAEEGEEPAGRVVPLLEEQSMVLGWARCMVGARGKLNGSDDWGDEGDGGCSSVVSVTNAALTGWKAKQLFC